MSIAPGLLLPERPEPRPLADLVAAQGLTVIGDVARVSATGIAGRTQDLRPGDVFAALPGAHVHGAAHAAVARDRGAVAVLTDPEGAVIAHDAGLPLLVTPSPREALGAVAGWIHRTSRRIPLLLGVTGTNGKTTTVHLLEHVLDLLGTPAGVSSTAERGSAGERVPSRLTTPEADELHALLARLAERGARAAAIEVSAQALVRSRTAGLVFDVAGFTNLTHDHLDDFGTMEAYLEAKSRLFLPGVARRAVVSLDSPAGATLAAATPLPVVTVSLAPGADWFVHDVAPDGEGTRFVLSGPRGERLATRVGLIGAHQAANAALALLMVAESGVGFDRVAAAVPPEGLRIALPGRLERVPGSGDPAVYLDVAHTPDAIAKSLEALRPRTAGRLVVVLGADGDRDITKRGPMGGAAARLADALVVHDHHSRFEDPGRIRAMLLDGARAAGSAEVHEVPDPAAAVRLAMDLAGPGGTVLWTGTGRTEYRDVGGTKRPYSYWAEAGRAVGERIGCDTRAAAG